TARSAAPTSSSASSSRPPRIARPCCVSNGPTPHGSRVRSTRRSRHARHDARRVAPMTSANAALDRAPVVGLLLAAGFGRRFDAGGRRNKLLARLPDGQTIVAAAARTLCGVLDHVAVVVPSKSALLEAALSDLPVRLIRNARADEGMGTSIATGIAEL